MITRSFWKGRRVLLTGHTGFKGSWLALLLRHLGAELHGIALEPISDKGLFVMGRIGEDMHHTVADVCDMAAVQRVFDAGRPEIVLHLAAQPLVRVSYADPVGTYRTNVMGALNVLECARHTRSVQAIVVITSDKCYENVEHVWGYREHEPLGGHDPYSSSKACVELITDAYRRSYFSHATGPRIASARAGNVFGGGDWSADRLVPDAMRAFFAGEKLVIRSPESIRPWQHVLDPVVAYLMIAERLINHGQQFAEGWNIGPSLEGEVCVADLADLLVGGWGDGASWATDGAVHPHEATYLKLDCSKARLRLNWRPLIELEQAVQLTLDWYKGLRAGADMRALSLEQIEQVLTPPAAKRDMVA